mgnify:FL=1
MTAGRFFDMTGKRYGDLIVLGWAGKWTPSGSHLAWRVRCKCGREYETAAHPLRQGQSKRCRRCAAVERCRRGKEELSVHLPNGKTIAQVADAAGLPLGTVYRRWLRGWPVAKLGLPRNAVRGIGGSIDLPERRRTMIPEAR